MNLVRDLVLTLSIDMPLIYRQHPITLRTGTGYLHVIQSEML